MPAHVQPLRGPFATSWEPCPASCAEKYGNVFDTVKDLATRYEYVLVDAGGRDSEELRTAMVVAHKLYRSGCRRSLIGPGIRTGFASPNGCRKGSCWKS